MQRPIDRLLEIMAALRTPETGCPWDLEQDFKSLAPYTLEEAYEVVEAIESGDPAALKEELGDLLLQVVFHAQLGEESGLFDFDRIVLGLCDKLVRRHPHVFSGRVFRTPQERQAFWEASKVQEKQERGLVIGENGRLGSIPAALPALMEAQKLQARAARVGFDWPSLAPVLEKLTEEVGELHEALSRHDPQHSAEELGDVLFVLANVARHLGLEAEGVLRAGNRKFRRRFAHIEARLAEQGLTPEDAGLERMEALWLEAKALERSLESGEANPQGAAPSDRSGISSARSPGRDRA